jgi:recombinational DNA repair protein RecR
MKFHGSRSKTPTKREIIQNLKEFYDRDGADGCGRMFSYMLKKEDSENVARLILSLIEVVYKMDTCKSDCFEGLETKHVCVCHCNDEIMWISFDLDDTVAEA